MDNNERIRSINDVMDRITPDLTTFAQKLVQTQSMTCREQETAAMIEDKMRELGYDEVTQDETGNVLGRIGNGPKALMFDSHMDTVAVIDEDQWEDDPFSGLIKGGKLYGRGSVDMKCPLAASVYGAYVAREAGLLEGVSIYVSASVMEEDFDGEAVRQLLTDTGLRPDGVIICEPTDLKIATGHRGRALIEVKVEGKSCHASNPSNGINPIYLMKDVIQNVEKQADILDSLEGEKGSLALTNINCNTPSNNSVPQDATIILDRRLALGESEEIISREMDALVDGTKGQWYFSDIPSATWTGRKFLFHSFLPAWNIDPEHPLVATAAQAYQMVTDREPVLFRMGASTNGVTTAGMFHLPTIVFGPGNLAQAHSANEFCSVEGMLDACRIYAALCGGIKDNL